MNIIFLDIDGVLNTPDSFMAKVGVPGPAGVKELAEAFDPDFPQLGYGVTSALACVDPVCVGLLNRMLVESGAGIVLSSTHRGHFIDASRIEYNSAKHLALLRQYLTLMGVNVPEFFSITERYAGIRGNEVADWINKFQGDIKYAILDDGRDFHPTQNLVKVNGKYGITFDDYVTTMKFLDQNHSEL